MIPIHLEGPEDSTGYGYDEFKERFIEICEEHKATNRALAFAMILYDLRSPEVPKVLRDRDYWRSLHELSGASLTVFSIAMSEPGTSGGVETRWMSPVSAYGDPGQKTNRVLQSYFDLNGNVSLPAVLFFQVYDSEVVDCHLWEIESASVEETYQQIRDALRIAVVAVENVTVENRGNSREIFSLMQQRLHDESLLVTVRKCGTKIKTVAEAVSLITLAF